MGIDQTSFRSIWTIPASGRPGMDVDEFCASDGCAEAAACHQVLALILGEPAEVPMMIRNGLYALGPVESSSRIVGPRNAANGDRANSPLLLVTVAARAITHPTRRSSRTRGSQPFGLFEADSLVQRIFRRQSCAQCRALLRVLAWIDVRFETGQQRKSKEG